MIAGYRLTNLDPSQQYGLIVSRIRVYPGIMFDQDTHITVFLDKITDITLHPLFGTRTTGGANDRFRPRSMPQRNLNHELPSDLGLEPDSLVLSEVARFDPNQNENEASRAVFHPVSTD